MCNDIIMIRHNSKPLVEAVKNAGVQKLNLCDLVHYVWARMPACWSIGDLLDLLPTNVEKVLREDNCSWLKNDPDSNPNDMSVNKSNGATAMKKILKLLAYQIRGHHRKA